MCELLIKANDSHTAIKKGFVVYIKDSPSVWGSKEGLPDFIRVIVPDATKAEIVYLSQTRIMRDFACSLAANIVTVRAASKTLSGLNSLDRTQVAAFATLLGCTNVTIGADSVSFKLTAGMTLATIETELTDKLQDVFEHRRYYFDRVEIDKLVGLGQTAVEMSKAQLLSKLHDRMAE